MKMKLGQRVESVYKSTDGRFRGLIVDVIKRKDPDPATNTRYKVKWDHGNVETLNSNRIETENKP
jgi:hypothetical protein